MFKKNWKLIILVSILNAYIANAYGLWGYHYLPTGIASFIYNLSPFVTAIIAYFVLNTRLTKKQMVGLLGGIFGFMPALIFNCNFYCTTDLSLFIIAFFAVFFAMIGGSYGWIMLKQLVYDEKVPIVLANGVTLFLGGIVSFMHSALIERDITLNTEKVVYVFALALISQVICYPFYSYLLKKYSTIFMAFASLISTAFTAVLARVLFGEPITISFVISMILVSLSLYIFYQDEPRDAINKHSS